MLRSRLRLLERLYRAALKGVEPENAVSRALRLTPIDGILRKAPRVGIFAVGKAAAGMVRGAARRKSPSLVILPRGYPAFGLSPAEVLFASHPEPDSSSLRAARRALRFFSSFGEGDVLLCLISGGASSLLALPRKGITLAAKRRKIQRLIRSGASILEVNRLRKTLSAVKGGRLGRATQARLLTLVLSDVPGDRPSLVGSGPTVRARRGDRAIVVGSNAQGLEAAAWEASLRGVKPVLLQRRLSGEARKAGKGFARAAKRLAKGEALLGGGETTVALSGSIGRGGRNLEFALGAALEIEGSKTIAVLAAGSDGHDGSSSAAGAFVDGTTIARARSFGLDPQEALARHETHLFFERLGDLFVTGPTGTNVGDWAFALRV